MRKSEELARKEWEERGFILITLPNMDRKYNTAFVIPEDRIEDSVFEDLGDEEFYAAVGRQDYEINEYGWGYMLIDQKDTPFQAVCPRCFQPTVNLDELCTRCKMGERMEELIEELKEALDFDSEDVGMLLEELEYKQKMLM